MVGVHDGDNVTRIFRDRGPVDHVVFTADDWDFQEKTDFPEIGMAEAREHLRPPSTGASI